MTKLTIWIKSGENFKQIRNKKGKIAYILDVDHDRINAFDEEDEKNLSLINNLIVQIIWDFST